jgi:hypothetical protein
MVSSQDGKAEPTQTLAHVTGFFAKPKDCTDLSIYPDGETPSDMHLRRRRTASTRLSTAQPADGVVNFAKSLLILDSSPSQPRNSLAAEHGRPSRRASAVDQGLALSRHATIGRNSDFKNLTEADREKIGGLEYRSLQLLLKVVFCKIPIPYLCFLL